MSSEAMHAFHRLRIRPRLDGTSMLILQYLCWRHHNAEDAARPSLARIQTDLDIPERTIIYALDRLDSAKLIKRRKGGGRARATRYFLPFMKLHLVDADNRDPILWDRKHCNPRQSLEGETLQPTAEFETEKSKILDSKHCNPRQSLEGETLQPNVRNSAVGCRETLQPTAEEKKKTIKRPPASAPTRAGGLKRMREILDKYTGGVR